MSNNIFYDPYNEIRCDRFALEKLVNESEAKDQRISELEEQLKESEAKDQQITELQKQLEEKDKEIERLQGVIDNLRDKKFAGKTLVEAVNAVYEPLFKNKCDEVEYLKQQLKSQPKEIVEKIRKWGQKHYNWVGDGTGYDGQNYNECIGFNMAIDQLNEILDAILNGVSYD